MSRRWGVAVLAGTAYGLVCRWSFGANSGFRGAIWAVMTGAFIFLMPTILGYIVVASAARRGPVSLVKRIFLPWPAVLAGILISVLAAWEGGICVAMMTPCALLMATLGGLLAGARERPASTTNLALVAMLPFVVAPIEQRINRPIEMRDVHSAIVIEAAPTRVWANIRSVRPIAATEQRVTWSQRIGFPRPVEAALIGEGVGAVRRATFDRGVEFRETVTAWEPERRLAFSIRAEAMPSGALDDHVTVGGPYFDVLEGEYQIEPVADGRTLLRLRSRHRLSTTFNFYASIWSDAVMRDVQENILEVIRARCERKESAGRVE